MRQKSSLAASGGPAFSHLAASGRQFTGALERLPMLHQRMWVSSLPVIPQTLSLPPCNLLILDKQACAHTDPANKPETLNPKR